VTGIGHLNGRTMVTVEDVKNRRGELLSVGETVPGLDKWQVASADPVAERVTFRTPDGDRLVSLGNNLTGKNADAASAALTAGRGGAPAVPAVAAPGVAPAATVDDRINPNAGLTEPERATLRDFLRTADEAAARKAGRGR
jgi:hypothetical protein